MADTIIEKENHNNTGAIITVVAIVLLVLAAIFVLPGLFNGSTSDSTNTGTSTSVPTPTTNTAPITGQ